MTTWRFELEGGGTADIANELSAEQMAEELMSFGSDGYVYDDDTVISVRRIVAVKRVACEPGAVELSVEQVERFVGKYEGEEPLTPMEKTALRLARDWLVMRGVRAVGGHDCANGECRDVGRKDVVSAWWEKLGRKRE